MLLHAGCLNAVQLFSYLRCKKMFRRFVTTISKTEKPPNFQKVVFSGIQPTGLVPHLGNYLGALKPWVALQNSGAYSRVIYSIVDLHAMTAPNQDKKKSDSLKQSSLDMACALLACGIDPSVSVLYRQSQVAEHTLLSWLLSCHSSLARLYHLTQWRQKAGSTANADDSNVPAIDVGLYTYPILMAADILLFKATHVPVGEDQLQHLRLAQEIARKFNNTIFPSKSNYFPVPEVVLNQDSICSRVHSLRDPTAKMSKSDPDKRSRINLDDDADTIRSKLRKAVTDTHSQVSYDPEKRPGVSNLIAMYSAITGKTIDAIVHEACKTDTGAFKLLVAESIIEALGPIRSRYLELRSDYGAVERILEDGAKRARSIAQKNWKEIAALYGLS